MIKSAALTDIFFDLDHTLWDFEANSAATFALIFSPYDYPFSMEEFMAVYTPVNHAYWKLYRENKITTQALRFKRLEKTFSTLSVAVSDAIITQHSNDYIEHLSQQTHLFEGTHELLMHLSKKYRLHIITNGFENVQQKKMDNSGITHYFDVVLTAERAGVKKPHVAIFEKALEEAGVEAKNSLMIGDSWEADIQGALQAGMQAIHFNSHDEPVHTHCPMVGRLVEVLNFIV